jgi:Uma2 family endonuclease
MAIAIEETTQAVERRLFTVDEYHLMMQAGIIAEDERVELIAGEIIKMSPIGPRHAICVGLLTHILDRLMGDAPRVISQSPIHLGTGFEPQPDVIVLKEDIRSYNQRKLIAEDVLLLVEVSDSTLEFDRDVKVPLYAEAGIAELWIVNLRNETVEVFAQPSGKIYEKTRKAKKGTTLLLPTSPVLKLKVDEIFS